MAAHVPLPVRLAALAAVCLIFQGYLWLNPFADAVSSGTLAASYLAAALAAGYRRRKCDPSTERAWAWSCLTAAAFGVGWIYFFLESVFRFPAVIQPAPGHLADLVASGGALTAIIAISAIPRAAGPRLKMVLDGVLVTGCVFGFVWVLLLDTLYQASGGQSLGFMAVVYLLLGALLAAMTLLSLASLRRPTSADLVLLAGYGVIAVTTLVMLYSTLAQWSLSGNGTDGGFLAGSLLVMTAAGEPAEGVRARPRRGSGLRRAALPYVPLVLLVCERVTQFVRDSHLPSPTTCVEGVVIAAVLARQYLFARANAQLARELEDKRDELTRQALYDPLTGLANRLLLAQRCRELAAVAAGTAPSNALIVADLDGFKGVNDTYGHAVGDELLAAVAVRLQAAVRADDLVARLGGDEFAIVLEDAPVETAHLIARRILGQFTEPVMIDGRAVPIGLSVGLAHIEPGSRVDPEDLLRRADNAMYRSKDRGKGCYTLWTPASA
jgi:diguanylate cyclase (GGDEF)-like protein